MACGQLLACPPAASIILANPATRRRAPAARRENEPVDLARTGWLATVVVCLIAVVILALQGYYGYAGVTLAVAISAAINLR